MKILASISFIAAVLLATSVSAATHDNLTGRWQDNASGPNRMGALVVGKDKISVGPKVSYQVKGAGDFGDGELFEVTNMIGTNDQNGCGPDGKVRFIAIQPLPTVPGLSDVSIRVFFYSGTKLPSVESIQNDIGLCSIHPFSRANQK